MEVEQIVITALGSSVVATIITKIWEHVADNKKREDERRQKLYGPLIYNLMILNLLEINRDELIREVKFEKDNFEFTHRVFAEDVNPLVKQWQNHVQKIRELFESFPGEIKEDDIILVQSFLDGCIKRDITKNGQSIWTTKERIEKILTSLESLKNKFLP